MDKKERNKRQLKRYHEKKKDPEYRENRNKKRREWHKRNREKTRRWNREWSRKNKGRYNARHAEWQRKRHAKDPVFRLNMTISRGIRRALSKGYGGKWQDFVDYTLDELKAHLEFQFDKNMTWQNYGKYWHIDHCIPLSRYKKNPIKAWVLHNLQPLEAKENIRKSNK